MFKFLVLVFLVNLIKGLEGSLSKSIDLNYTNPEITGGATHECYRVCKKGENKKCVYHFTLTRDTSMSYACKNCPFIASDCFLTGCITAGGHVRSVSVINHMLPGPSIQVCEGDTIQVTVSNGFSSDSASIHWHGIHQYGTPFMDGVPYITQCPILPNTKFDYEFKASPAGTHIYHSHSGSQEADGTFGSLVVRIPNDILISHYDFDLAEHVMIIWHWYDVPTESKLATALHTFGNVYGYGLLINGLAPHIKFSRNNTTFETPRKIFHVNSRKKYRFRVIYNSPIYCPLQISIDNHKLLAIASETGSFKPIEVDTFIINSGERYDFVLEANQKPKNYWIRYRGLGDCLKDDVKISEASILHYNEVKVAKPSENNSYQDSYKSGVLLNPVEVLTEKYENNSLVRVVDLENLKKPKYNISGTPNYTYYFEFKFNTYHSYFIPGPYPQINDIAFVYPPFPLLSQPQENFSEIICNDGNQTNKKCIDNFCKCLSIYRIKKNSLVEIVFVDTSDSRDQDHPMHLHGNDFHIVSMESIGSNISMKYVKDLNEKGLIRKKLEKSPLKDNISIPSRGFTIIRFISKNPGYWFFHCHIANHMEMGMNFVLKVGDDSEMPKVPVNFPKCGNFNYN